MRSAQNIDPYAQIASGSIFSIASRVEGPPKLRCERVFTQPEPVADVKLKIEEVLGTPQLQWAKPTQTT